MDESNFASLACTCKSADKVRKNFAEPYSGLYRYFEDIADMTRQTISVEHISTLLWSLNEAYFTSPRNVVSASIPIFFSIHRMLFRPSRWDGPVLESVYSQITACEAKHRMRYASVYVRGTTMDTRFVDSILALGVLKTQIQAMIQQILLTDDEMDAEFVAFDSWQDDDCLGEVRERLDLGFDRGLLMAHRETITKISTTCGSRDTSNLSDAMIDLEKRMRRGRTNADISMAAELATTLSRVLERAIFHGYEDETLRMFGRAIDLVFPM
ncbi:hypothetical protein TL16_g02700 [Triparma laevis f. inornata]|uniref:Uncharacterized protein n=1 Tax=Triparma laevis f. inornata TaxID=1714386 RepID=A0A9W6ZQB4_9STRA|nr:hypothetical protein TL16_g02700 [Triparma laevis f. inornata]